MTDLPFEVMDVLHGVHRMNKRPENEIQKRDKPRASGLTSDAREIAYQMSGTPLSNPHAFNPLRMDSAMTQEQGRIFEDLLVGAIENMDLPEKYVVEDRQISLPHDYFVTGHPDGRIGRKLFESKHYGRFAYKELARDGIWGAKGRDILAQAALYCDALDLDGALIFVTSQDASSMRYELKNTDAHPKLMIFDVDRSQLQALIPQLKKRAEWFTEWAKYDGNPANVAWEHEPSPKKFPYSYSEYLDRAVLDGPGMKVAPSAFPWE